MRVHITDLKKRHFTKLFIDFAGARQEQLRGTGCVEQDSMNNISNQLLSRYPDESEASRVHRALLDPYFPLGMLERTLFADVDGMRFFINKSRPDLEPVLIDALREWSEVFLRIRSDIETSYDPATITCIPLDGMRHRLPTAQWCTLCGICCQIGGVPPMPPPGVLYPNHWSSYLAGDAMENQQLCPFLYQYFGELFFFCAIHNIKPAGCRQFGKEECLRRLNERNLHSDENRSRCPMTIDL
jgi:hypothetical protein